MVRLLNPDFSAIRKYLPVPGAENTKTPAAFVFVSRWTGTSSRSSRTDASPTGLPVELRTLPWIVTSTERCTEAFCAADAWLDTLNSAAKTPRAPKRCRQFPAADEGRGLCEPFILTLNSSPSKTPSNDLQVSICNPRLAADVGCSS